MSCSDNVTPASAERPSAQPLTKAARNNDDRRRARIKSEEVLTHIPALRIYARSLCRDATLADDIVQDTLLRAIAAIGQFRPGSNLRAWLFTILRNSFFSTYARRRRESPGSEDCVSALPEAVADQQIWTLTCDDARRALERMPPHYRDTLLLVTVSGYSYIDAAAHMHCDIGTIKSRINRARALLREDLGDIFCH